MQFQALGSRRYVCKPILGALGNGQHRREGAREASTQRAVGDRSSSRGKPFSLSGDVQPPRPSRCLEIQGELVKSPGAGTQPLAPRPSAGWQSATATLSAPTSQGPAFGGGVFCERCVCCLRPCWIIDSHRQKIILARLSRSVQLSNGNLTKNSGENRWPEEEKARQVRAALALQR